MLIENIPKTAMTARLQTKLSAWRYYRSWKVVLIWKNRDNHKSFVQCIELDHQFLLSHEIDENLNCKLCFSCKLRQTQSRLSKCQFCSIPSRFKNRNVLKRNFADSIQAIKFWHFHQHKTISCKLKLLSLENLLRPFISLDIHVRNIENTENRYQNSK